MMLNLMNYLTSKGLFNADTSYTIYQLHELSL